MNIFCRTTKRHVFPAIANRMKGLPAAINYLDGVWSGHFMRADAFVSPWPELFLYSKKDFYLPQKYMEEIVLPERRTAGKTFYTKVRGGGNTQDLGLLLAVICGCCGRCLTAAVAAVCSVIVSTSS